MESTKLKTKAEVRDAIMQHVAENYEATPADVWKLITPRLTPATFAAARQLVAELVATSKEVPDKSDSDSKTTPLDLADLGVHVPLSYSTFPVIELDKEVSAHVVPLTADLRELYALMDTAADDAKAMLKQAEASRADFDAKKAKLWRAFEKYYSAANRQAILNLADLDTDGLARTIFVRQGGKRSLPISALKKYFRANGATKCGDDGDDSDGSDGEGVEFMGGVASLSGAGMPPELRKIFVKHFEKVVSELPDNERKTLEAMMERREAPEDSKGRMLVAKAVKLALKSAANELNDEVQDNDDD